MSESRGLPAASHAVSQGGMLRRFARDRSGNAMMLFSLALIPLTAIIGLAVDFGRVYAVRAQTQSALDAAALAAGRVAQVEKNDVAAKTQSTATTYFNKAKPSAVVSSTLAFTTDAQNTEFQVTATSWVKTPFLAVLHMLGDKDGVAGAPANCQGNFYGCVKVTTTATAALCPSAACSASNSGGSNVEVAVMLDVTGSMCQPCSKIDALRTSAQDLIDIVVWDDQSEYYSRVALVPFAEAINVGTTLAPKVRGSVTPNQQSSPQVFSNSDMTNTSKQPTSQWIRFPKANGSNCSSGSTCTWQISSKCVTERIGQEKYTDAAPDVNFPASLVGKGYFGTNTNTSCGVANYSDPQINLIRPLTSDKALLKKHVKDELSTGGSTAGHLGTAWAWYMLSPNWNAVLQSAFPDAKAAAPYSDLDVKNSKGQPKLRKIAILMTDGEYNINYCKGVEAKNSDQNPDINCNSENGKSLVQAAGLCTGMKDVKIEVYTVGFQVNSTAKTFLKNCATDAAHYYDATSDIELQQAFRDIALKIATLRLTN
jgi:Flp pilus assembly protein TadG